MHLGMDNRGPLDQQVMQGGEPAMASDCACTAAAVQGH